MTAPDHEQAERLASRLTLEPTPEELQQASDALLDLAVQLAERKRALNRIDAAVTSGTLADIRRIAREALAATHRPQPDSEEKNPCPNCGSTTWTWKSAKMSMKDPRCSDCSDSEERG